jgi:fermentation-respiration switch protein FrsA (DUF1100 family)
MPAQRARVSFTSGGTRCAAWHYPGANGGYVVMTGGFGVTKEPATDRFAERFSEAGFGVLAFDYRRLGESGGEPRQVQGIRDQLADWDSAVACAARLPGTDPARVAIWGFSLAGGHVFKVAAGHPEVAAAIAQTPNTYGLPVLRNANRHQTRTAMLGMTGRAIAVGPGGLLGREPLLVPLCGQPGTIAVITQPDGRHGDTALNPSGRYPQWQQEAAARSVLSIGTYSPARQAAGELARIPGGHCAPFLDGHEQAVEAELDFLRRHLLQKAS